MVTDSAPCTETSVEVTPEMIDAGADRLFQMLGPQERSAYSFEEVAEAVFKAMLAQCTTLPLAGAGQDEHRK